MQEQETGSLELELAKGSTFDVIRTGWGWSVVVTPMVLTLQLLSVDLIGPTPRWPLILGVLLVWGSLLLLPPLVLRLRQRRGARVTWSDWGVTEWDGDAVRLAIPWSLVHYRREDQAYRGAVRWLLITDGGQRQIAIGGYDCRDLRRCRRRLYARAPEPLVALIRALEARSDRLTEDSIIPWSHRPDRLGPLPALGTVLALTGSLLGAVFCEVAPELPTTPFLLLLAAVGFGLRALRPLRELVSVLGEAGPLRQAVPVELSADTESRLEARTAAGETYQLDTELMSHPDGQLVERRGRAWVVLDKPAKAASPYRGASGAIAPPLETEATRATRRTLTRAIAAELVLRLLPAWLALAIAAGITLEPQLSVTQRYEARLNDRCAQGDSMACHRLATLWEDGREGYQDRDRARQFNERACQGGVAEACADLGMLYHEGRGVEKAPRRAVELFQRACDGGLARGCFELAGGYESGRGVERDRDQACRLYKRSCLDQYQPACEARRRVCRPLGKLPPTNLLEL